MLQGLYQPHLTRCGKRHRSASCNISERGQSAGGASPASNASCNISERGQSAGGASPASQALGSVFSGPWGQNPFALAPDLGPFLQPPSPTAGILTGDDNGARAGSFNGDQDGGLQGPRAEGHAAHVLARVGRGHPVQPQA